MNRNDIAKTVYDFCQNAGVVMTRVQSTELVKDIFATVAYGVVEDGRVTIDDFGTFTKKDMKAKVGHNIHTKERINIPAKGVVRFKPSAVFKKAVE